MTRTDFQLERGIERTSFKLFLPSIQHSNQCVKWVTVVPLHTRWRLFASELAHTWTSPSASSRIFVCESNNELTWSAISLQINFFVQLPPLHMSVFVWLKDWFGFQMATSPNNEKKGNYGELRTLLWVFRVLNEYCKVKFKGVVSGSIPFHARRITTERISSLYTGIRVD